MNKAHLQRPATSRGVMEFPPAEERAELERNIEARLHELTIAVAGFSESAFNFLLAEKSSARKTIEELTVRVNALNWILRVAERSTGTVREGLWADIDHALTGLEKAAELATRAGERWAQMDSGGRREWVVHLDPI
jgi:hypothetical protein